MIRFKRGLAVLLSVCMIGGMMPLPVRAEETDSEIAVQANDSAGKTEQQSTDEASVTINGETLYYATLEEAFSAADGKTATITMLNDAECTVTSGSPIGVMNKSNITLNMNGKTLSGHGTGDCGIITLATGSLSVQGPGTMKSTFKCLSCQSKNAKMTVENITFDVSEADYGVWVVSSNTVTLNNIQIIGKAKIAAVYQYSNSANVTINNMNAIEAGYSDVVYKGGTLKINGGTFDKISVTSNNTGGITSVSQVLGEGCIYRYADKTWETSELSNMLEISNVTVEKIPLTMNPEAETSWYYNSAEHSLHMNAEPTTAGNDISYEWYDGDTKLECDSDTYTIPKTMPAGSYTYTCKATCDGYTLSHEFTFTVEECKHEGIEITFDSNGFGNCPKCNATVYQPAVETTDKYDIDDDGTKDTVYEISNAGQLYWFAGLVNGTLDGVEQNASANAILTANITANENLLDSLQYDTEGNVSNGSNFTSWTPIGSWNKEYTGTFDGNNKTVSGLYFNDTSICIGLFGSSEGNIKNVGVVDSYFKGNNFVAGVCGFNDGTIENCYNTGNILTFPEQSANVGGVCGRNTGSITNCYNTGTVTAPGSMASVGGVCGSNNDSTTNCYNVGTVTATDSSADVGGVCGVAWGSTTNCYYNSDAYNGDAIGYGSATAYDACKTTAQFASGEVAYLLSQGCTIDEVTYDGIIWGQRLGEDGDTYPVLDSTKRVYQVDKYDGCEGKPGSSTKVYSNQSTSIYEEHKYEADTTDSTKHKCSICNGTEEHSFAYELVENGNAIKATCSECGATYTVKLTQPAATSDEKIVYNGIEKKAGTAIDSGNTGIETIPENAITYAAVTNGTPSTYSAAAPKNAGTYKAKLTLGTGDNIVSIEINFTIEKATPIMVTVPTVAGREYDPVLALTDSELIGGSVTGTDGNELAGTWSFTGTNIVPTVNNKGYQAVFTPTDTANYNTVTRTITVKVTKATPVIAENPTASVLTYGQTLSDSTLTEGKATYKTADGTEVAGTFAWKNNAIKPTVADSGKTEYDVTFTPSDTDNYNAVDTKLTLTVNKAAKAPDMPGITMAPAHSTVKVGDITLPNGWSWQEADKDTALEDGVAVTATAVYTGADKGNYETESVSITITRSECEHSYTSRVTKEPTTTDEGIMTYTCSRCGYSYTQPIEKLKADDNRDNGNENRNPKLDTDNNTDNSTGNGTDNSNSVANGNTDSGQNSSGTGSGNETVQGITERKESDAEAKSDRNEADVEVNSDLKETDTEVKPYIKDDSGKEGWEVIRLQLEEAESGDTVTVAMNGTTVVPKEVFDSIKDKDVTLAFDMGNDIVWKISGNDVTEAAGDIDLGVTVGADAGKYIPVDVINNVTGDKYSMNMTLAYDGQFGFTATLAVNMESKNAGLYANLFYYNAQTGKPEFICAGQIDADGNVELTFTHASDYIIVVDKAVMDGINDDSITSTETSESLENAESTENSENTGNTDDEKLPVANADAVKGSGALNPAIIIIIVICILLIASGAVIFVRKKSSSWKK